MKPLNLIDRLLLALVVALAACCAGACAPSDLRPQMDRRGVIALHERDGALEGLPGAITVWSITGVHLERCGAGIPVVYDPGMDPRQAGEYQWHPQLVRVRLDDATILAHELGHVLGLDDLPDGEVGVMSKIPLADELTDADLREFERSGR